MDHKEKVTDRTLRLLLILVFVGIFFFPLLSWWNQRQLRTFKENTRLYLQNQDWKAAEQAALNWTEREPQNSDAWLDLAEAYRQQQQYAAMAEALGQVSDSDPRVLKMLAMQVDVLLTELQKPIQAMETCERILKIDPQVALARQRLIYINAMLLRPLAMVEQIREAIPLKCEPPEAYVYLLLADSLNFSNGAPLVNGWLKGDPGNEDLEVALAIYVARSKSSQSLKLQGGQVVSGGDQSLVTACLEKYPQNREVLAYFLEQTLEEADLKRAASLLEQAPPEAEADNRFWRFRGRLLALKNQLAPAEASYRQALQRNPYNWKSRLGLAEVLRRTGETEEAEKQAQLGAQGKEFFRQLMELDSPSQITADLLEQIADYALECGDQQTYDAIQGRL
ncbi:tetratricopeptide repeat protein [Gimesia panareensis]|uniref:tetratricopeptide repeat protein n=1 Tax=Gimesia panareensis TaxID=2527978 RepID=UPI00118ACF5A|nr:tetratricopeptide repeat protein [Gimesia panareensis]QDU49479.1 Tetratricopeptide repeat protein [Gimesia panareensis]